MSGFGSGSRILEVPIAEGVVAKVRVLSQHPEDDHARRNLYRASALWDWADKQVEKAGGESDRGKATQMLDEVVEAKMLRDKARREAVTVALSQNQSGEDIERILRQCDDQAFLLLFNAAQGLDPMETVGDRLKRMVQHLKLTPAETLSVCYTPEELGSWYMPLTGSSTPTIT